MSIHNSHYPKDEDLNEHLSAVGKRSRLMCAWLRLTNPNFDDVNYLELVKNIFLHNFLKVIEL